MKLKAQIMDEAALNRALMRIAHEITEKNKGVDNVVLVGIRRRGEPIAQIIRRNIEKIEGVDPRCGSIDIGFYRDDLSTLADTPLVRRTELPFDVTGRDVVLVDDVLYTGRTARAAIEAVFSCGRPKTIQFADTRRLRRKKHPHLQKRACGGSPPGIRRRDRRVSDGHDPKLNTV